MCVCETKFDLSMTIFQKTAESIPEIQKQFNFIKLYRDLRCLVLNLLETATVFVHIFGKNHVFIVLKKS